MLFLLFGSSGAGKTAALRALRNRLPRLAVHDYDEVGVPPGADVAWRQRTNELWLRRALAYQQQGVDLLLAGQTPYGELLAAPSAPLLDGIAACLLDCDDETRLARLRARGVPWLERGGAELDDYVSWAAWLRGHADDPQHLPYVIRIPETEDELEWSRLADVEWCVHRVDSSARTVQRVAEEVAAWIERERAAVSARATRTRGSAPSRAPRPSGS